MDLGLKDKVALVTGAGSQIGYGKAIVLLLAHEGCNIVVADIDMEGAEQTAAQVCALGRKAIAVKVDVRDGASVDAMVNTAMATFGKIDILVNNAGSSSKVQPFLNKTKEDWQYDIEVNLFGQMNVAHAVLPHMIARKYGRIVNITGAQGIPNISTYGAAKAGIAMWTQSLAREVASEGVIVNAVYPGLAVTAMVQRNAPREFLEWERQRSLLKRLCTPDDVAPVVAFLSSDRCSYMLGQELSMSTF